MSTDVQEKEFQDHLAVLNVQIDELSHTIDSDEEFFKRFLEGIVTVLGVGGGVWTVKANNAIDTQHHINLQLAGLEKNGSQFDLLGKAFIRISETNQPVILPASDGSNLYDGGLGKDAVNRSQHTMVFVPIVASEKLEKILLVLTPPDIDPRAIRGFTEYLTGLCRKASLFLQRLRMSEMNQQLSRSDRFRQYVSSLHSSLDPRRSCYALANYAQEMLGVYRCLAGTYNSAGKFRMESVSGLESVAVKSNFIKSISKVARQVCQNNKVLLVDNPNAALSRTEKSDDLILEARLYMLEAKSQTMGVFPIVFDNIVVGALVIEKAKEQPIEQHEREQIDNLLVEAGSALSNGLAYRTMPMAPILRPAAKLRDKVYRMHAGRRWVWLVFWAILFILPMVFSKQVKVKGTAELTPMDARVAYANQEGLIERIDVPEDRQVQKGDIVARLDTKIIDAEIDRITNVINETRINLHESKSRNNQPMVARYQSQLISSTAQLKKAQLDLEKYLIRAPLTGQLITRESELRQMLSKPVNRGDAIIEVVPNKSTWDLTVKIPEAKSGQLLKAFDALDEGQTLKANIILNAYPDTKFESHVISVSPRAYVDSTGDQKYENVIEILVAQPENLRSIVDPRVGLEGKVSVECGERSLYFAYTHEFMDFLRVAFF